MSKEKSKKKFYYIIGGILAIIVTCLIIFSAFSQNQFAFDDAATDGNLEGLSQSEIEEMMNNKVEESMLAISINTSPEFKDGEAKGSLRIENTARNRYNITVEIARNDNQQVIYKSKGIKPGQMIEYDQLDVKLSKGEYPCTATFNAFDPETNEVVGKAAAIVNILISK